MKALLGMRSATHEIPAMTHELSKHWDQPARAQILLNQTHALMSDRTLQALANYSTSVPSGVYEGKMWRTQQHGKWWLRWYGPSTHPDKCTINTREIVPRESI